MNEMDVRMPKESSAGVRGNWWGELFPNWFQPQEFDGERAVWILGTGRRNNMLLEWTWSLFAA